MTTTPLMIPRLFSFLALVALASQLTACSSTSDSGTSSGEGRRAYMDTPSYQDQQPFAANPSPISTFYDSSYEESIYSPFSFN